ncbi:ABC transporter permease [Tumebacillus algifaecis]|uniref:ABC transporter permease n=1 Tax=Tumebacillus algifaecis TaxID=1214604 RepID=A0A223D5J2_9BACL|nr:ABC transporter permease subunit [Tumebacillus algifaecis]ASS76757.1 ABC transporter permease [Tumebacillus algifaecis]
MNIWILAKREMKLGFRNPWSYSFLVLFFLFSLALLLILSDGGLHLQGYTHSTGMMINFILYLLPLMTLLLGSFSLTSEKEDGTWRLLSTYPLSSFSFLLGKFIGLCAVLLAILCAGFGLFGIMGALLNLTVSLQQFQIFIFFSIAVMLMYLGLAMLIGTLAKNRWQALTVCVGIWFLTVLAWPTLLIGMLQLLPYPAIQPVLGLLTLLNPAELVRIVTVIKIGGGSVFGPEYYRFVEWAQGSYGTIIATLYGCLWLIGLTGLASRLWERGRHHD